ncbi:hypothetical protein ASPZODRAFT_130529 [Penicilliopsis zonata CBS 506.65]|uniref:Chromatin assembly factor 1 subunit A n=1 Tax=Penicilliopsis zonata CBS 506.65 TaxID=1073090 RepID=A0A1L9SMN3_9EURO|nr:hypothetical protein ASPZODRAFT_130529 [Penicilliopsis zonata CBS 506.65]OJJ48485.1 hypothetical protein ASPZODRAFT_130529 [Penicilliopsis zonata CBS 506.65]
MDMSVDTQAQGFSQSPSRKRSFHETENTAVPSDPNAEQENTSPSFEKEQESGVSGEAVGPSESILSPIPAPNTNMNMNMNTETTPTPTTPSTGPPNKKRKLSPASKAAKAQEKEAKERQRVEEKAKKEEEKRVRDEEKKKRDAEREEERKRREEQRKVKMEEKAAKDAAKEEEKKKREDEKSKKERSQMRLNAFFAKPTASSPVNPTSSPKKTPANKSMPQADEEMTPVMSDYQREFPEFFVQSHTTLAPMHRFERDAEALQHLCATVDAGLRIASSSSSPPQVPTVFRPSELFHLIPYRRRLGRNVKSVKNILIEMQNENHDVTPAVEEEKKTKTRVNLQDLLRRVPMKTFRFGEDVRPPYQGTFSKPVPDKTAMRLSRNPFRRELPETNYDYDSEAEWEEPEEGEDLDSEEEEEGSDDGEDDMDGFLDDEEDGLAAGADGKRRLIVGDLEPVCSGLCWADDHTTTPDEFQAYRIETTAENVRFPIDPFSTAYWEKPRPADQPPPPPLFPSAAAAAAATTAAAGGVGGGTGPSGRSTLHAYAVNSSAQASRGMSNIATLATGRVKRPFPPEQLAEFKAAVDGSDLTKAGLIEVLKKRFPKVSKDVLRETLNSVAVRVGQKEADKKWCIQSV